MIGREFIWNDLTAPGIEHLRLAEEGGGFVADGMYVGRNADSDPYRLHYVIQTDKAWRMRAARIHLLAGPGAPAGVSFTVDENCAWKDADGNAVPDLGGCHEIDLFCSAFTNSLAIHRLGLSRAESAEIPIAYVDVPEMRVRAVRQRYSCIEPYGPDGGRYRCEALFRTQDAELSVDSQGLVVEYPGSFRRVWESPSATDGEGA